MIEFFYRSTDPKTQSMFPIIATKSPPFFPSLFGHHFDRALDVSSLIPFRKGSSGAPPIIPYLSSGLHDFSWFPYPS